MREMTVRQQEVLGFIRKFTEHQGAPPTVREIGEHFGFTARAAFDHLKALERKGMLQRRISDRRVSRTLVLTQRPPARKSAVRDIPVMGRIAAGTP
ncbi:MAG: repressor LexA, partial [Candidatus Rokubacteria bacterium]|nr:repressor LexA [Candidatus Rokubacteria bacterium]